MRVFGIIVLIGLLGIAILEYKCSSVIESYYMTYDEVLEAEAIGRGWIPEFLPKSAKNIVEKHNIENNWGVVEFSFSNDDKQLILSVVNKVHLSKIEVLKKRMPSVTELDISGKIDFYMVQNDFEKGYLAVNWVQLRAIYWFIP